MACGLIAVMHATIFTISLYGQSTPIVGSTLSQSTDLVKYVRQRCPHGIHVRDSVVVQLHVVTNTDGTIKTIEFAKGDPRFRREALRAVKVWKYKPVTVQGMSVETKREIQLTFLCP